MVQPQKNLVTAILNFSNTISGSSALCGFSGTKKYVCALIRAFFSRCRSTNKPLHKHTVYFHKLYITLMILKFHYAWNRLSLIEKNC